MKRFEGQVAIVTGASDGIGRATADILARDGASVLLVARNAPRLDAAVAAIRETGGRAAGLAADATQQATAAEAVEQVLRDWGRLDILVNNVGGSTIIENRTASIDELGFDDWNKLLSFNLDAMFHFCQAAVPVMKKARFGKIVNVSSVAGRGLGTAGCGYVAAKAAIVGVTKRMASEVGPWNINVNATAPALTVTDRLKEFWHGRGEAAQQDYLAQIPLRRVSTAVDQANVICFLASAEAGFLTGLTLNVDGGQH